MGVVTEKLDSSLSVVPSCPRSIKALTWKTAMVAFGG
jgi:hypothetical protein